MSGKVRVIWEVEREVPELARRNIVWAIRHRKTFYYYINTGREEAERRFQAEVLGAGSLGLGLAELDGPVAHGHSVSFSDHFVTWVDPGEQMQGLVAQLVASAEAHGPGLVER